MGDFFGGGEFCGGCGPDETGPTTQGVAVPRGRVMDTKRIESGEVKMEGMEDEVLVGTLKDLEERIAYDKTQHGGQAGPDGAYLEAWRGKVAGEMKKRGMEEDEKGQVWRNGAGK